MSEYERYVITRYERKLIELMGEKEFSKFACQVAKEAFRKEAEAMPDGDFKDFILASIEEITEEPHEK